MRKITQQDIYRHWLGDIIIGNMYNSPIPGRDDGTPSFCLYVDNGQILWKDFGLSNQFGNKPENLVQHMEGIELTHRGFFIAKERIEEEVGRAIAAKPLQQLRRRISNDVSPYIKPRDDWKSFELDYWKRFGIDKYDLAIENVRPMEYMSWEGEDGKAHVISTPEDPAFVYWWSTNPSSWKMYRPLGSLRDKFRQENIGGVIEGWNSMVEEYAHFDILFILSSSKDRLVVKKAYGDTSRYNAINPKGESEYRTIVDKRDELMGMADRIVILYDADEPGHHAAKRLSDATGLEHYNVPIGSLGSYYDTNRGEFKQIKDFSDWIDSRRGNHSHEELVTLINNLIN